MARKTVTIELSLLDADVILNQLGCNLEGILILKDKLGRLESPYENRLTKAVMSMQKQIQLTELEERQIDITIQAHNDLFKPENLN